MKKAGRPTNKSSTRKPKARRGNRKTPHLATAVLCEKVLQEKDEVTSLIRVIDTINLSGEARTLPPGVIVFNIVVNFKSGEARGRRRLRIVGRAPSGKKVAAYEHALEFKGDEHGVSVVALTRMSVTEKGLYWFDVLVNREMMTRIPLRINYLQQRKADGQ